MRHPKPVNCHNWIFTIHNLVTEWRCHHLETRFVLVEKGVDTKL
jgi:hypothetical protein